MAQTVTVTDVDLQKEQDGGVVDFFNDTGATIVQGSMVEVNKLIGNVSREVLDDKVGSIEFQGVVAVYKLPLLTTDSNSYAIGALVSVNATGEGVPRGTASSTEMPFMALPKNDVIKGASGGPGLTSDVGAAAAGDSYVHVGLMGPAYGSVVTDRTLIGTADAVVTTGTVTITGETWGGLETQGYKYVEVEIHAGAIIRTLRMPTADWVDNSVLSIFNDGTVTAELNDMDIAGSTMTLVEVGSPYDSVDIRVYAIR